MIDPTSLLAWSALALVVTVTPGPDTLLVASHAARGGLRAGLSANLGIQAGGIWYMALFGLGLLQVLAAAPTVFAIVKVIGAAYLVWLGLQLIRNAWSPKIQQPDAAPVMLGRPFRQGLLTNVLNPKVALFYLAALPQFTGTGPDAPLTGVLLIAIHYVFGGIWLGMVAMAAERARTIALNSKIVRALEAAIGVVFIGIAARLAWSQR